MSVNDKMTAIANLIRTLTGKTDKMGLDAMGNNLGSAVNEVDTQNDLIQQIKTALQGKVSGGDGVVETWIFELDDGTTVEKAVVIDA